MQGEGNKVADRRYREEARDFAERFDPKDHAQLQQMATSVKDSIDRAVNDLAEEASEQAVEGRRLLAQMLMDVGSKLAKSASADRDLERRHANERMTQ